MSIYLINLSTDERIPLSNPNQVIDVLYNSDHHICTIESDNRDHNIKITEEVLNFIKYQNNDISNINDQMLPSIYNYTLNGKFCTEIEIGKYSDRADKLFMFSSPRYDALTSIPERRPISFKALNSLAMMGHLLNNYNKGE